MSKENEIFFTDFGCMDGRTRRPIFELGQLKFGAYFPDTITEPGMVGLLVNNSSISEDLLHSLKRKLDISILNHHSRGIIVHGHQECAGNPVDDDTQRDQIRNSLPIVRSLTNPTIPIFGVFIKRSSDDPSKWEAEEIPSTVTI